MSVRRRQVERRELLRRRQVDLQRWFPRLLGRALQQQGNSPHGAVPSRDVQRITAVDVLRGARTCCGGPRPTDRERVVHRIKQATTPTNHQPTNQPINQPTNQPTNLEVHGDFSRFNGQVCQPPSQRANVHRAPSKQVLRAETQGANVCVLVL